MKINEIIRENKPLDASLSIVTCPQYHVTPISSLGFDNDTYQQDEVYLYIKSCFKYCQSDASLTG